MRILTVSLLILLLSGCSSIRSQFDELHLVYASSHRTFGPTPSGFNVSPEEIYSLVPQMKVGIRIYADAEAYYLREEVDTIGITTISKTNSEHAKKYGLRVSGVSRDEYEYLKGHLPDQRFYTLDSLNQQLLEFKKSN